MTDREGVDMGKSTRWQPPHPPKVIGEHGKPRKPGQTHWVSKDRLQIPYPHTEAAKHVDRLLTEQPWCIWPGCDMQKHDGLQLCRVHTGIVVNHADRSERAAREELARLHEQHLAEQAEAERIIEAGKKLDKGPIPGWCYIVKVDDLIKIGYSAQPEQRLRAYPPNAEVLAVFPGTKTLEKDLHGRFRFALRKGREWFRDAEEIRAYVAEVTAMYGPPETRFTDRYRDANRTRQYVGAKHNTGVKKTAA